jgi:hypothetical protein
MKTQPWTHDKLAARQRQHRLAARWSVSAETSLRVAAASGHAASRPTGWLEQRLERVNRIAVLVAPGAVAIVASLFG